MSKRHCTRHAPLLMKILQPKILLIVLLALCWDIKSGIYASSNNKKLRNEESLLLNVDPEAMGTSSVNFVSDEESAAVVGPFVGNAVRENGVSGSRRKKEDCGLPTVASRGFVGPTLKRSYFAYSPEEVAEKVRREVVRRKREVKRTEIAGEGPLPWTCEAKYEWKDMGADHYPRFVRTAECKARLCFNGFFRCRPRRYKTKVLKRLSGADTSSCEEDDASLPETLRSSWRFITVTINLCCDCTGRIPGTSEI